MSAAGSGGGGGARSGDSKTMMVTANTEAEFNAAVEAHAGKAALFALFTGAVVPTTGRSWCPDCVEADPVLHAVFDKTEEPTVLIQVPLVREEYKGNAAHWAR